MRKATVVITGLLLALVPAVAHAKTGVIFQKDPAEAKVGEKINITVVVFKEPRNPTGQANPIVGKHPLVTFQSKSGRVIHVRSGRTDAGGMGKAQVAFPDKGPWTTTVRVPGMHIVSEPSNPLEVGIGLVQVIPPANAAKPQPSGASDSAEFPWLWVLSVGSIASALLVFVMRRHGHWGAT